MWLVWYDMWLVWYDMRLVWYDMWLVWYDMRLVWYDMRLVWYDMRIPVKKRKKNLFYRFIYPDISNNETKRIARTKKLDLSPIEL